jgi:formamidopyrimidine-DNA glycosylase
VPELPEVEVVRAGLDPAVTGATVVSVNVLDERALTRHSGSGAEFEAALTGRVLQSAARRGKFLWIPLRPIAPQAAGASEALVAHLGMSGQLLLRSPGAEPERHERVRLDIQHPEHGELAIVFADQRTFGSLALDALVPTPDAAPGGWGTHDASVPSQVAHISRDPLDPAFRDRAFRDALGRKDSAIKRVLLDQTTISGVGNIYADEALWRARIHPETPARRLPTRAVNRLLSDVRAVLEQALAEGGTSFDAQYVNVNGQAGYFAHSLNAYGRTGEPCPRCGHPVVRVSFMNRSSHYCPHCQKLRG